MRRGHVTSEFILSLALALILAAIVGPNSATGSITAAAESLAQQASVTPSTTGTATPSSPPTATHTPTATRTSIDTGTPTIDPTLMKGVPATDTPSPAPARTVTPTSAPTNTPIPTATATVTAVGTTTPTASATLTSGYATATSAVATANSVATSAAATAAADATATAAAIIVATADAAATATAGAQPTPTDYPTSTPEPTWTPTTTVPPPSNDDFGSAIQIEAFPFDKSENTAGATVASDDPQMADTGGQNSATVWYKFVPSLAGRVETNSFGSDYDTVLAAFAGNRGSLSHLAANDDTDGRQSAITFDVQAGATYYIEVAGWGVDGGGQLHLSGTFTPGASTGATGTPTLLGTPTATGTPQVLGANPPRVGTPQVIPPLPTINDPRYFSQTGFRIDKDPFWDYFQKRGGVRTFGYPISREFTLSGFPVQLFQRELLQLMPDGSVATMNLLDEGLMPYTHINSSVFPAPDMELTTTAPIATDPEYAPKAVAFVQANVPDRWEDLPVNFLQGFLSTVRYEDAFPAADGEPALIPLMNLEFWGLPTSKPAYDPNNHNFVYQRFQRGILHFDAATGTTQGLLLGEYLKAIMTGEGIPPDLDQQARLNPFYHQYDRNKPGYLARPTDLRGTNLVGAFEMDLPQ